jgi:hypothetical protein
MQIPPVVPPVVPPVEPAEPAEPVDDSPSTPPEPLSSRVPEDGLSSPEELPSGADAPMVDVTTASVAVDRKSSPSEMV